MQFEAGFGEASRVVAVEDEDEGFAAGVVVAPEGSNLVLAANVLIVERVRVFGKSLELGVRRT